MLLLLSITIINLLIAFANAISTPIRLFLLRPSAEEKEIMSDIIKLKCKLTNISMQDEYIEYVKVERKINALDNVLIKIQTNKAGKTIFINYGLGWGTRAILSLILIIVSITYRYTPVIVFDNKFNFSPFSRIMNFPTGIDGAISVPFWIFITNFTCRTLAGYIKT